VGGSMGQHICILGRQWSTISKANRYPVVSMRNSEGMVILCSCHAEQGIKPRPPAQSMLDPSLGPEKEGRGFDRKAMPPK
jgi:hypothetical protein